MAGETDISKLIKSLTPKLNRGTYVFCSVKSLKGIKRKHILSEFKEREGITIVLEKQKADELELSYDFKAAWITLEVHSSLEAVGLTAVVANELAKNDISCNVIAGYFHDHLFVARHDAKKAMRALRVLSKKFK